MKILKSTFIKVLRNEAVICNMCGQKIETEAQGYLDSYLSVEKRWGYGSTLDGQTHSFDLCAKCYEKITSMFAIPPVQPDEESGK